MMSLLSNRANFLIVGRKGDKDVNAKENTS